MRQFIRNYAVLGVGFCVPGCATHRRATRPAGCVTVSFKLDAERKASDIHVLDSKPPGLYDYSAVKAVQKANYPTPPSRFQGDTFILVINYVDDGDPHAPVPVCKASPSPATTAAPAT